MLGKLIKYEIKATARQFLPLYGALVLLAIINKIFFAEAFFGAFNGFPAVIAMFVYGAILIAICVLTLLVTVQRFYHNLLSDEGYLMFTLPVKTWELITSKLIIAVLWVICGGAITSISLFILSLNTQIISTIPEFINALSILIESIGFTQAVFVLEMLAMLFLSLVHFIAQIYAAISIGHLIGRHRFLASFGALIALNVIQESLEAFLLWLLVGSGVIIKPVEMFLPPPAFTQGLMIFQMCLSAGAIAIYLFVTNYILSRRLNLD